MVEQHLAPLINKGDTLFTSEYNTMVAQARKLPLAQQQAALNAALNKSDFWASRDAAVEGIAAQYLKHHYAVQFLFIVSPLVTWLWTGAMIAFLGGLIALIPPALVARRRSPMAERSPVAVRELV